MKADSGAAVDRAEMLDAIGMVARIEVQRDDAALARILILRRRNVNVAVAADRKMADGTQPFRNDRRVKPGRQRQTVRFTASPQRDGCTDDHGNTKHLHSTTSQAAAHSIETRGGRHPQPEH